MESIDVPQNEPQVKVLRELVMVLIVGVLPMVIIGACLFPPAAEEPRPPCYIPGLASGLTSTCMLLTYACFLIAPAVAMYRSRQPLAHFGIVWRGWGDVVWGLGGFVANYISGWIVWGAYWATGFPLGVENIAAFHYFHVSGFSQMIATWPWYVMVVIAEEQMARCYLITRFRDLTGSDVIAVLAATTCFASWHMFWGASGVFHVFKAGLIFGYMFCKRKGIGSVAIAHFVFDGLALLPK